MTQETFNVMYEKAKRFTIRREYDMFVENNSSLLSDELLPLNLGWDRFKQYVAKCEYKLGMAPRFDRTLNRKITLADITFVERKTLFNRYAKRGRDKKSIQNIFNVEGYGISLSLYGWYDFFRFHGKKISLTELHCSITSGVTIDSLIDKLYGSLENKEIKQGYVDWKDRKWLLVNKEDALIIINESKASDKTIPELLHQFAQSLTY